MAFFHKNRRGTSPREIDPPAPFSGGCSFSEQNAGGALGDLYGTIFSQAETRGKPFMGFPLVFLFSQTLQTLRSFAHPLSPADDSGSSRRRRRSACSTQSRRSGRNPVPLPELEVVPPEMAAIGAGRVWFFPCTFCTLCTLCTVHTLHTHHRPPSVKIL